MASHHIDISDYEKDPRLFLFTSLTAGSSHIITATSRMETILKANKIPFQAIDLATDEKARRLWQRRAKERKLPGLVKDGFVLGDLDEIEEWNEFGELKENIGSVPASNSAASNTVKTGVNVAPPIPVNPTATQGTTDMSQPPLNKAPKPGVDPSKFRALPGAAEIAERNKAKSQPTPEQKEGKSVVDENVPPGAAAETMTSAPVEKEESINAAKKLLGEVRSTRRDEHLSAPVSALQSGTATPEVQAGDEGVEKVEGQMEEAKEAKHGAGEGEAKAAEEERVKSAPVEEAEKAEGEAASALPPDEKKELGGEEEKTDEPEAEKPTAPAITSVEASDGGEGKAAEEIKEQSAKAPEDAGKSVGD